MTRRRTWILIAASLLLVSPVAGPVASSKQEAQPTPPVLGRAEIAGLVQSLNPRVDAPRAQRIAVAVTRCEAEQGLRSELVLAVMTVESNMRPSAQSPKGAMGLMQVMPHMFDQLDLPGPISHLETNVEAGCMLLADNIRRLGEKDGISSYFWGSRIGGDAYLRRVQAVLDDLAFELEAPEKRSRG